MSLKLLILCVISEEATTPPPRYSAKTTVTVEGAPEERKGGKIGRGGGVLRLAHAAARPGGERVGDENADKHRRQAEPGQRILQVVVGQVDRELTRLRQAAGRHRRLLFDVERRDI